MKGKGQKSDIKRKTVGSVFRGKDCEIEKIRKKLEIIRKLIIIIKTKLNFKSGLKIIIGESTSKFS